eukprot:TRINITY_DN88953_c0_g1_i1.p1 TRINITY_DN88953_c0_g1~~TRINITY_DN88953_c0_g1_i1.p1  ORF type:complete len:228 (+),score=60.29 TRINITY_DN88953_c0_g1_i1:65-748(+)
MASSHRSPTVAFPTVFLLLLMHALCGELMPTFCSGSSPSRLIRESRRLGYTTSALAEANAEVAVASSAATLQASEPLRFASGITGLLKPLLNAQAKMAAGEYDQEKIRALIETESKSAPVVMYTLSQSPFSIEAKRLLTEASIDFKEIEVAPLFILAEGDNAAKRAELGEMTGRTSMPHIFINGQSIGGLYDGTPGLAALIESGELTAMVQPQKEDSVFDMLMKSVR